VTSKPDFKVMVLLLVFMQLTRDLFAIAKFLFTLSCTNVYIKSRAIQQLEYGIIRAISYTDKTKIASISRVVT